jgi:glyoxylase-like metal-dependent hydrolase (beta-lactamase superfamily II)
MTAITAYTRSIDFGQPASRAFGPTMPPTIPGAPAPQPGTFNQNILPANQAWTQQLQIWVTPWAFLKGAAANAATARRERVGNTDFHVVTWTPAAKSPSGQSYRVVGYINVQTNMVDRVETWVEHAVMGDLHVDTAYSNYRDFAGLKVPGTIVQKQAGIESFNATIANAAANPANITELLTPPPAAQGRGGGAAAAAPGGGRGGAPAPATVEAQSLAPGVFRITGGYIALAVDMGDHVVVLESGQNEARGLAVLSAARQALPGKPVRYVFNSHPHFDHASGLAPIVAEGITIITHNNNRAFLERALGNPRTLVGDTLAKANRKPLIEGVADRRTLRGTNGRVVELYHVPNLEHSDGMLVAHLPAEKMLFSGDFGLPNPPAAGAPAPATPAPVNPSLVTLADTIARLRLDYTAFVPVHPPVPDRPLTHQDLLAAVGRAAN